MFLSLIIGTITGLLYGLSFLTRKKALWFYDEPGSSVNRIYIKILLFSITRLLCFAFLFYYLLIFRSTSLIMILLSFVMAFWLVILKSERII